MGSEWKTQEAKGQMGFWFRVHKGERNYCFSRIQLVGQKINIDILFHKLKLDKMQFNHNI